MPSRSENITGFSGRALLELVVLGYEVASRVRGPYSDLEYSYATAAMAARAMRLDRQSAARALALCHLSFPVQAWCSTDDFDFLRLDMIVSARQHVPFPTLIGTSRSRSTDAESRLRPHSQAWSIPIHAVMRS